MADIFDEVTEELRQDQLKTIWKRYNKIVFIILLVVVLGVGLFKYYEYRKNQISIENANLFFNALEDVKNKKFEEAESKFLKIKSNSDIGYYTLSLFALADISEKKQDEKRMQDFYDLIIENQEIDDFYKNLAIFYSTKNSTKLNYAEKLKKLEPILTSPNKLQAIASELEILYLFNNKQNILALKKLDLLMKQKNINVNQINRLNIIKEIYEN